MAATVSPPLCSPLQYHSDFKVYVRTQEPIWSVSGAHSNFVIELSSLLSQLDFLCRKELILQPTNRIDHGKVSHEFEMKAILLHDEIKKCFNINTSLRCSIEDYIEYTGIAKLFPRASTYLCHHQDFSLALKQTVVDDHFQQTTALYQIQALASQIRQDLYENDNHKFIAHQLALLYQSMKAIKTSPTLSEYKAAIQSQFDRIKDHLHDNENSIPTLDPDVRRWLYELLDALVQTVLYLPSDATDAMQPLATFLYNI